MTILLSVGTVVSISTQEPSIYSAAGFGLLSFTDIGEIVSVGEFGGTAQIAQHIPLDDGVVTKRKGSIDYGTMGLQIGRVEDAGQSLLKAAFDGANSYSSHSFKIESSDGELAFFTGVVSSFMTLYNDSMTVTGVSCNIELDNEVMFGDVDIPANALLETTTLSALLETTTGEYLLET